METDTGPSMTDARFSPRTPETKGLPSLPEEILCLIASELEDRDIAACELVTPSWNASFGRPLVVRDCIARSFTGLLHRSDALSDGEMRHLYRATRNRMGFRRRGQFVSCMAEYPLRKEETYFASDPMPPPQRALLLARNEQTGKTMGIQCLPSSWANRYHRGCLAWRLSDQFTIIDDLETMSREIIKWPGYEELTTWDRENPDPDLDRDLHVGVKAFTEDLLVLQDSREVGEVPVQRMSVYHRHLKQWRTVDLPGTCLSYHARFDANATDIVYRATVKEGELPHREAPRCGTGLWAMRRRRAPVRQSLHRWSWANDEDAGFRPLKGAEVPPDVNSTTVTQLGAIFHPTEPSTVHVVTVTLSRRSSDGYDAGHGPNAVHASAVKYYGDTPANAAIEYEARLLPGTSGYSVDVHEDVKFPYSPSSGQGEHLLATVRHGDTTHTPSRLGVSAIFFNPLTERFSHTSTPNVITTWPDLSPDRHLRNKTTPLIWSGLLHRHESVHEDLAHRYPKLYKQPLDAFVRFAAMEAGAAGDARKKRRYLPIPEPGKWRLDNQLSTRIVGDDRYLILMHAEGYVVWCFEERHGAPTGGWQSWEESRPLVAEVQGVMEEFFEDGNAATGERRKVRESETGGQR